MTLATGLRLGPWEILASLDAGGMAEPYQARDSGLVRDGVLACSQRPPCKAVHMLLEFADLSGPRPLLQAALC
jgi:hypothetical protein